MGASKRPGTPQSTRLTSQRVFGRKTRSVLTLDGVSANSGKEGFEGDRIVDMYELFDEVASAYGDQLQLIVVDDDLPAEVNDSSHPQSC